MKLKNFFKASVAGIMLLASMSINAATINIQMTANSCSNLNWYLPSSPFLVKSISVTAPANNVGAVTFVDAPTNALTLAVSAYTNWLQGVTNYINVWTNYYGVTNYTTNAALTLTSNYVAASTYSYPVRFQLTAPTNLTANIDNINSMFYQGVLLTNSTAATVGVTVNYQK